MKPGFAYLVMARDAVNAQKAEHNDGEDGCSRAVAATLDTGHDELIGLALAHGADALATCPADLTDALTDVQRDALAGALAATWLDGLAVGAAYRRSVTA